MDCDEEDMNAEQLVIAWAFSYAVCNTPIIPRVGQVWPVESDTTISVYEIAGFQKTTSVAKFTNKQLGIYIAGAI